jgi:dTDP-4-amino-4,6-dideoxygalactose transaminase
LYQKIISLPLYSQISKNEQDEVISCIKNWNIIGDVLCVNNI